jgi:hypothetical protein
MVEHPPDDLRRLGARRGQAGGGSLANDEVLDLDMLAALPDAERARALQPRVIRDRELERPIPAGVTGDVFDLEIDRHPGGDSTAAESVEATEPERPLGVQAHEIFERTAGNAQARDMKRTHSA